MKLLASVLLCFAFLSAGGCASDPNGQAAELRALYKEVQTQSAAICADPGVDPVKCADLQRKIASFEPIVAGVEIAAATASQDPGKQINFQVLWNQARPKVEALLLDLVLKKYLGAR